jgi:lipopolysaccharide transport system ATP-binding protein
VSDLAIRCEGIDKQYRIGQRESYRALRDTVTDAVTAPFRRVRAAWQGGAGRPSNGTSTIWALKDVSFEVRVGEVVGIIGRNGAGKSTLLKILSRITKPTRGWAEIQGRVGSLLEVGTGFHPELTGRENVYLNGAILGMKKAEIARKFDEIVAFAEVEQFIDTPVKRYSSGMYMRLAFAVAAHLDTEILLVDEVLAVGDAQFQKRCLGKMGDVATRGRTVLFVSHNMGSITRLCGNAIWIDRGVVRLQGKSSEVVSAYTGQGALHVGERVWAAGEAPGDEYACLRRVRICQPSGVPCTAIDITRSFHIEVETEVLRPLREMAVCLKILSGTGDVVLHTTEVMSRQEGPRNPGHWLSSCEIPAYSLNVGHYLVSLSADIPHYKVLFECDGALSWTVEPLSPEMSRYGSTAWGGILGPGLVTWSAAQPAPAGIEI